MSLMIVVKDDLSCPIVICDYCGREITKASDGNYEWDMRDSTTKPTPLRCEGWRR